MDSGLFSPGYVTARYRFREAAERLGCTLETYPLGLKGPRGEALCIDVAIGGEGAGRGGTLLISSGLHGVEGFFGSALQLGFLQQWAGTAAPAPRRWVMLHALNPWGFAWRRRVDEHNVDLNRNLLLAGQAFRGCPEGYAGLDGLLNPRRPPSRWEPVGLKFLLTIARHGMPALKRAIASGQYDFPRGLFYGGNEPSHLRAILDQHFTRWLGDGERVVHLDLHTGLGRRGACKLLIDHPTSPAQRQWLSEVFGPEVFETDDAPKTAYPTRGSFGRWAWTEAAGRDYLYAVAEFGTCSAPRVLAALRAENQCEHWGAPEDPATEQAKQRLVEVFCPRAADWRSGVLDLGQRLVQRAIGGLATH